MYFTLHAGNDKSYVMLCINNERIRAYPYANFDGCRTYFVNIDTNDFYREVSHLASFVNNELGESFLIEIG